MISEYWIGDNVKFCGHGSITPDFVLKDYLKQ